MLERFDLYFGFEVPWSNEVVTGPETKLPKDYEVFERKKLKGRSGIFVSVRYCVV